MFRNKQRKTRQRIQNVREMDELVIYTKISVHIHLLRHLYLFFTIFFQQQLQYNGFPICQSVPKFKISAVLLIVVPESQIETKLH